MMPDIVSGLVDRQLREYYVPGSILDKLQLYNLSFSCIGNIILFSLANHISIFATST